MTGAILVCFISLCLFFAACACFDARIRYLGPRGLSICRRSPIDVLHVVSASLHLCGGLAYSRAESKGQIAVWSGSQTISRRSKRGSRS